MELLNLKQRKELVKAGLKFVEQGLVSQTWGNINVKVNDKEMLVTPSGKFYEDINSCRHGTGEFCKRQIRQEWSKTLIGI